MTEEQMIKKKDLYTCCCYINEQPIHRNFLRYTLKSLDPNDEIILMNICS